MKKRPALIQDRTVELALAAVLFAGSAWLVHDAFEGRGRKRPWYSSLAPIPG